MPLQVTLPCFGHLDLSCLRRLEWKFSFYGYFSTKGTMMQWHIQSAYIKDNQEWQTQWAKAPADATPVGQLLARAVFFFFLSVCSPISGICLLSTRCEIQRYLILKPLCWTGFTTNIGCDTLSQPSFMATISAAIATATAAAGAPQVAYHVHCYTSSRTHRSSTPQTSSSPASARAP